MDYKRYAFISYNHNDIKVAKWLHKKLESYKLPAEIHNEFEDSKFLRPVFRDQEDLNTGILSNELRKHLESSKYLIVICSPNSAKSEWVSNEVKTFIEWGRLEYIIPFIIDGVPNSDEECFPMVLRDYTKIHPEQELLGININEVGREKAFVRVVSRMLGVSFDELWKRHERAKRKKIVTWSIGIPIFIMLFYYLAIPVTLTVSIRDAKHNLPMPENALLVVNGAEYSLHSLDTTLAIQDVPGYYRGQRLSVSFSATYYQPLRDNVGMGFGLRHAINIDMQRDSTFAIYEGTIMNDDGQPVAKAEITIGDSVTQSDSDGHFRIVFELDSQSKTKAINIKKEGMKDINRTDECPSNELKYVMHK